MIIAVSPVKPVAVYAGNEDQVVDHPTTNHLAFTYESKRTYGQDEEINLL